MFKIMRKSSILGVLSSLKTLNIELEKFLQSNTQNNHEYQSQLDDIRLVPQMQVQLNQEAWIKEKSSKISID